MYPPERDQYESFLNDGPGCAIYYRLYQGNKLVAVTVADRMLDGLPRSTVSLILTNRNAVWVPRLFCFRFAKRRPWTYLLSTSGTGSMGAKKCPTRRDFPRLSSLSTGNGSSTRLSKPPPQIPLPSFLAGASRLMQSQRSETALSPESVSYTVPAFPEAGGIA